MVVKDLVFGDLMRAKNPMDVIWLLLQAVLWGVLAAALLSCLTVLTVFDTVFGGLLNGNTEAQDRIRADRYEALDRAFREARGGMLISLSVGIIAHLLFFGPVLLPFYRAPSKVPAPIMKRVSEDLTLRKLTVSKTISDICDEYSYVVVTDSGVCFPVVCVDCEKPTAGDKIVVAVNSVNEIELLKILSKDTLEAPQND